MKIPTTTIKPDELNGSHEEHNGESTRALILSNPISQLQYALSNCEVEVLTIESQIAGAKHLPAKLKEAKAKLADIRQKLADAISEKINGVMPAKAQKKATRKGGGRRKSVQHPSLSGTTTPAGIAANDPDADGTTTEPDVIPVKSIDLSGIPDAVLEANLDEFLPEGLASLIRDNSDMTTYADLERHRQSNNGHFVTINRVGRGKSAAIVQNMEEFLSEHQQQGEGA